VKERKMGSDQTQLSEPYPVSDTYVDGIGKVETTGKNLRMVFYTKREKDDDSVDNEIVERVVMPLEAFIPAIATILRMPVFREVDLSTILTCIAAAQSGTLQ
jgi:hypothetical protein